MANPKGNAATLTAPRFKPGQSGNVNGNPQALRQKINYDFLKAMKDDFEVYGIAAIQQCRLDKPDVYVKVVATFLPKEIQVSSPLDELTHDELLAAISALQSVVTTQGIGSRASEKKVLQ